MRAVRLTGGMKLQGFLKPEKFPSEESGNQVCIHGLQQVRIIILKSGAARITGNLMVWTQAISVSVHQSPHKIVAVNRGLNTVAFDFKLV